MLGPHSFPVEQTADQRMPPAAAPSAVRRKDEFPHRLCATPGLHAH